MKNVSRMTAVEEAIARNEIANGGRWCEVTMKKNGYVIRVVRVGYGPMERPEWDEHKLIVNGEEMFGTEFRNLGQVAAWICERY